LSIAVVPIIGLMLNYSPWGITLYPILIALCILITSTAALAGYRRFTVPLEDRFYIKFSLPQQLRVLRTNISNLSTFDRILVGALVVMLVVSTSSIAYIISIPKRGERFTEFYILGENGTAADYPKLLARAENATVIIGVVCNEYKTTDYNILIELMPLNSSASEKETYTVLYTDASDLKKSNASFALNISTAISWNITLAHTERWEQEFTFNIDAEGSYRLKFILFKEGVQEEYRKVHLVLTVT
jgi:uncharacterized membrane protein